MLVLASDRAHAQEPDLHGLIEIGGSDIKSVILEMTRSDVERIERAFNEREEPLKFRMFDDNLKHSFEDEKVSAARPENTPAVIESVRRTAERMTAEFGVPPERIYVFASSGVASAKHYGDLKTQLHQKLPSVKLESVSADNECGLTFRWITPRTRYREVVVIDIGSSNTKACYVDDPGRPGQAPSIRGFELLPLGTKTFADRVRAELQKRGLDSTTFASVARELRRGEIRQLLEQANRNNPGLSSLPRLYLAGGIVWATSNLTRPCPTDPNWEVFKTNEIVTLGNRLRAGRSYYFDPACIKNNDDLRKQVESEINRIQRTFSPEDLIAGTELLQGMAEQLRFNEKNAIFFAKVARTSWRSQLLSDIILNGGDVGSGLYRVDSAQIARLVSNDLRPLFVTITTRLDEVSRRVDELSRRMKADGPVSTREETAKVPANKAPIKVGIAGPLTGSDAALGIQVQRGVEMAAADINAKGGINGHSIELVLGDDQGDKKAVEIANHMVTEGVKIVIGHIFSSATLAASPIYAKNNILMITPSSTNVAVTERKLWNVFRTCGRDDQQGEIAGKYIADNLAGKKVAVIHDGSDYGKGLADLTKKTMNDLGVTEELNETVAPDAKDMSALVGKLKTSGIQVIYFGGYYSQAGLLIKQMRAVGVTALLIGGDAINPPEFAEIAGPGVEGTLMTYFPNAQARPEAEAVVAKFREKNITPVGNTLYGYAALQVAASAADEANSLDAKTIAETIRSSKVWKTVIGPITYDRKGDVTRPDFVIYTWKKGPDGKFASVEN
jgi:branched-chain amino acid transport system substrate-binding protein